MLHGSLIFFFFFFNDTATTEIYTLSLHDALPISPISFCSSCRRSFKSSSNSGEPRSEEHTSELQSPCNLVCRLLLEKKKKCPTSTGISVTPGAGPHLTVHSCTYACSHAFYSPRYA